MSPAYFDLERFSLELGVVMWEQKHLRGREIEDHIAIMLRPRPRWIPPRVWEWLVSHILYIVITTTKETSR